MIRLRQLLTLALPLSLAAAAPLAQTNANEGGEPPSGSADSASQAEQAQAEKSGDKEQKPVPTRNESPFEYRPSEEISEDLPVSFPVDI